jgi:hypothetical protein
MRRSVIAATALLASVSLVGAQGFDSYDYTSSSSSTTSYSEPEMKFSLFYSVGAGFSVGGVNSVPVLGDLQSGKNIDGNLSDVDDDFYNAGRGLKMDLGASYRFLEYVNVIGAFALTIGLPKAGYEFEDVNTVTGRTTKTTVEITNSQFGLKFLLAPTFQIFDLLDMYVGVGLGLYWNSAGYEYSQEVAQSGVATVRQEETGVVETKPSVPFIGMVGVEYPVADRLIIYLDGCFEAMNAKIVEVEYTESDFNTPMDETFDADDPNEDPPPEIPGSNFAIRLGVRVPLF